MLEIIEKVSENRFLLMEWEVVMKIFIGSSAEVASKTNTDKNILQKIAGILRDAGAVPKAWNDESSSNFKAGNTTIEDLERLVRVNGAIDAAVFIYSADDKICSRGVEKYAPRDNVIFEHGLFTAILGRKKAIMIKVDDIKIPSDLHGVKYIDYSANTEIAISEIKQWVEELRSNGVNRENVVQIPNPHKDTQSTKYIDTADEKILHPPKPNLCFGLDGNPEYRGSNTPYYQSEYDIFCRNDDNEQYRLTRISLIDGENTIYDHTFEMDKAPNINMNDPYRQKINDYELDKIEKYYRENGVEKCTIIVTIKNKDYQYEFDLTKFDEPTRRLNRLLKLL